MIIKHITTKIHYNWIDGKYEIAEIGKNEVDFIHCPTPKRDARHAEIHYKNGDMDVVFNINRIFNKNNNKGDEYYH